MQNQQSIFHFLKAGGLSAQTAPTVGNSQILIPLYTQILSMITIGYSHCLLYLNSHFPKEAEGYLMNRNLHLNQLPLE